MRHWLAHPLTRDLALDDPATVARRAEVLRGKPFLRRIYRQWYEVLVADLPSGGAPVLELGAGAGFLRDMLPDLISSDVVAVPEVRVVVDAGAMPFASSSLRAIVMTNVLHHLPDPETFLRDAARCLVAGGRIVMLEPWVTWWSKLVYRYLHHEPFDPTAATTGATGAGPLTRANGAIPWMLFDRDRAGFASRHPELTVKRIAPAMPLLYLLSGGLAWRFGAPGWTYPLAKYFDGLMAQLAGAAMFASIVIEKSAVPSVTGESSCT